ncbi:hypothetical protein D3C86_1698040 [compost metagenome]
MDHVYSGSLIASIVFPDYRREILIFRQPDLQTIIRKPGTFFFREGNAAEQILSFTLFQRFTYLPAAIPLADKSVHFFAQILQFWAECQHHRNAQFREGPGDKIITLGIFHFAGVINVEICLVFAEQPKGFFTAGDQS